MTRGRKACRGWLGLPVLQVRKASLELMEPRALMERMVLPARRGIRGHLVHLSILARLACQESLLQALIQVGTFSVQTSPKEVCLNRVPTAPQI